MPRANLAPVVSVLNMKGGVGKTTISAHVMRVLYHRCRLSVLLVDLDPQFNLSQALLTRAKYDQCRNAGKSVLQSFEPPSNVGLMDVATSKTPPPAASTIAEKLRYIPNSSIALRLVPGDFRLVKYSMIASATKLDSARERFQRFIGEARKQHDLVVIDCNPSSSFITTCALAVCTDLLVPVRPERYSVLGLELLSELLEMLPFIQPKPDIHVLMNQVPRQNYDPSVENQLRGHPVFGERVLAARLRKSSLLEAKAGYTGFATDKPVPYRNLLKGEITAVVDELAEALGCTP